MKTILALLSTLALVSCSSVVSLQPVGENPADLDKLKLAGVWANEDGEEVAFVIRDREKGIMAYLEGEDTQLLEIRQTGTMAFANIGPDSDKHYQWFRIKLEKPDQIRLQVPDADHFGALVKQDKIVGRVIDNPDMIDEDGKIQPGRGFTVVLDDPKAAWVTALAAGKLGDAFGEKKPEEDRLDAVLKRVGGPLR